MSLPTLTDEQRREALKKAVAARQGRAELLKSIKAGKTTIKDVFEMADSGSKIAKRMKVYQLLQALPSWGKAKTTKWMDDNCIKDMKRIGGLGKNQRENLLKIGE